MLKFLLNLFSGGIVSQFTEPLNRAWEAKLGADTSEAVLAAEKDIARIEASRDIAVAQASDRWSATSLGRLLIVVPFGVWWASIYLVQIINGLLGTGFVIIDVPARIFDMASILIPAIVIADAGALAAKKFIKR